MRLLGTKMTEDINRDFLRMLFGGGQEACNSKSSSLYNSKSSALPTQFPAGADADDVDCTDVDDLDCNDVENVTYVGGARVSADGQNHNTSINDNDTQSDNNQSDNNQSDNRVTTIDVNEGPVNEGPAHVFYACGLTGTGKTETTKDIIKDLGFYPFVVQLPKKRITRESGLFQP
jgi:hypothetical protein